MASIPLSFATKSFIIPQKGHKNEQNHQKSRQNRQCSRNLHLRDAPVLPVLWRAVNRGCGGNRCGIQPDRLAPGMAKSLVIAVFCGRIGHFVDILLVWPRRQAVADVVGDRGIHNFPLNSISYAAYCGNPYPPTRPHPPRPS